MMLHLLSSARMSTYLINCKESICFLCHLTACRDMLLDRRHGRAALYVGVLSHMSGRPEGE